MGYQFRRRFYRPKDLASISVMCFKVRTFGIALGILYSKAQSSAEADRMLRFIELRPAVRVSLYRDPSWLISGTCLTRSSDPGILFNWPGISVL